MSGREEQAGLRDRYLPRVSLNCPIANFPVLLLPLAEIDLLEKVYLQAQSGGHRLKLSAQNGRVVQRWNEGVAKSDRSIDAPQSGCAEDE